MLGEQGFGLIHSAQMKEKKKKRKNKTTSNLVLKWN